MTVAFEVDLVHELGAGLPNANSYADPDQARDYAAGRHRTTLQNLTEEQIEALLIRATDYIEQRWGRSFVGTPMTSSQALSWPRDYVYDELGELVTGVPTGVVRATIELAERAQGLDRLLPDPPSPYPVADADGVTADVTDGPLVSVRKKVDVIETQKTYGGAIGGVHRLPTATTLNGVSIQEFPAVVTLLRPWLKSGGSGASRFVRY